MKKIFYVFFFSLIIGSVSAQQNSISVELPSPNNGNIFSGIGLSYFKSITSIHAIGIRPSIRFDDKESYINDFSWQVDFLSRIQTSANEKIKTHLEFGGSFFKRAERGVHPSSPFVDICFGPINDVNAEYLGFVAGASIERRLGEHFSLSLIYRANLFFNMKEYSGRSSFFTSNPLLSVSYNF